MLRLEYVCRKTLETQTGVEAMGSEFYNACNLKGNPFRQTSPYGDDWHSQIWSGYEREKVKLTGALSRCCLDEGGGNCFAIVHGDYGTGKTHAMTWLTGWLSERGACRPPVSYSISTLKKSKGRLSFTAAFVEDVVGRGRIVEDVVRYRGFLLDCIGKVGVGRVGADRGYDEDLVATIIPPRELRLMALRILECDDTQGVVKFLSARPSGEQQVVNMFACIMNLFTLRMNVDRVTVCFSEAAFLFIDELDDLGRVSVKEAMEVNDLLRHLCDGCPRNFGLVVALSSEAEMLNVYFTDYVLGRVNCRVSFNVLERKEALSFVKGVMDGARIEGNDIARCGYFPFTEAAVLSIISQLSYLTARKVVNVMQQVLEEVRMNGVDPRKALIDVEVLDGTNVVENVIEYTCYS